MKRIVYALLLGLLFTACTTDSEPEVLTGGISGSVSDKTTGEPVAVVNVQLLKDGSSTVTGSDGSFYFYDLESGTYTIKISKEGYRESTTTFYVAPGKMNPAHLLIERIPASITPDRDFLDFGESAGVTTLSFAIVNAGYLNLDYTLEYDCKWMDAYPKSGSLKSGKTETIVVSIDRELLESGNNETVLVVKTSDGRSEVVVNAIGEERSVARVNTLDVTDVRENEAQLNGEITNTGAPAYTQRGFVYHTDMTPTLENTLENLTAPIDENKKFFKSISKLQPKQIYYVRAYCIQNEQVIYGNTVSFSTAQQSVVISTSAATQVEATKAILNADVVSDGIPAYTERGFCYGFNQNPTIADNKEIVLGTGVGSFSLQLFNLEYPRTYYVRAYCIQSGKPVYGNMISFETSKENVVLSTSAATQIESTKAMLNANISNSGNPNYTEKGFCYSKHSNPTISDNRKVVEGLGIGNYSLQLVDLDYPETYYACAYCIQAGEVVYGNVVEFNTTFEEVSVSTSAATNIESSTAQLNGIIVNAGEPVYKQRGFCYSETNTEPTVSNKKTVEYSSARGSFRETVSDLKERTTYYVRAYALQENTYVYGKTVSFKTSVPASVRTNSVSNLKAVDLGLGISLQWTAQFNATVLDSGEPAYTKKGFVYDTTMNPTVGSGSSVTVSGSGTGTYSTTVSNLQNYKTYYVRAFVKTSLGYIYGENVMFQTY